MSRIRQVHVLALGFKRFTATKDEMAFDINVVLGVLFLSSSFPPATAVVKQNARLFAFNNPFVFHFRETSKESERDRLYVRRATSMFVIVDHSLLHP